VVGPVDRQRQTPKLGVTACVVGASWADLEPSRGTYDFTGLDRQFDEADGNGLRYRLRLYFGTEAPTWAKTNFGFVKLTDPQTANSYTTARWWGPGAIEAMEALDQAVADRYGSREGLAEKQWDTWGSQFSAENNIRQSGTPANRAAYLAAGYDDAKDETDGFDVLARAVERWKEHGIRTTVWVHKRQRILPDGKNHADLDAARTLAEHAHGLGAVIGVNSADAQSWPNDPCYALCTEVGGVRTGYQTVTKAKMGGSANLAATMEDTIVNSGRSQELYAGYETDCTAAQIGDWQRRMGAL
jgi:hypothetical protein